MKKYALLMISSVCLAACSVGPDYKMPQSDFVSRWFSPETPHVSETPVQRKWWGVFNDPLLEGYIAQAVRNNKDIEISLANLRRARALQRVERGAFLPQIGHSSAATRSKASELISGGTTDPRSLYDSGFDASWEIDIFGGTRRANEAAEARMQSAAADYQGVMLSTLSEVARNYFEARGLQKRITILRNNAALQEQTYDVVKARLEVGEANEFDLARARAEYQLTQARLPNLEADLRSSIYALSILLGQMPEALLTDMQRVQPLPSPPDIVPVGLRSEIVRRRPDIRMAERALAAEVADIGVETAALFPKFYLTGDVGSQARVFGDLFDVASGGVWSLGGLMQWSVFEGGAIRARIAAQEASSQAALASYEKKVLEAFGDVEGALTQYGRELETRKRLDAGVRSRKQSVALAKELFDAGETDYLAVLDSERELTASEDDLIISETRSITKLIALYTALGGGWEVYSQDGVGGF